MQVREIMTPNVECARPDTTLQMAAQKMKELNVGPLPVCGDNDHIVGIVTDRDIAVRAVADGKEPRKTQVRDVMTPQITYCFEDQHVAEAAKLMQEKQIRRLVVLNRDGRLVGIVSLGDLAVNTKNEGLAGEAFGAISEPAYVGE